jgi:hypothetical protein
LEIETVVLPAALSANETPPPLAFLNTSVFAVADEVAEVDPPTVVPLPKM